MPAVVTLLSDFGTQDGFVAAMKGVVLTIAPEVCVVDATHEIEPGDVEAGAFVLWRYWDLFPSGTVHVAVVDPGVGSPRKALALAAADRYVVAPDNGLVTRIVRAEPAWRCVEIAEPRYMRPAPSTTFHGRDIFAPAAAHLAIEVPLDELGPPLAKPVLLKLDLPERRDAEARGRVAHIDRFGNLISDLPGEWLDETWRLELGGCDVGPLRRTYADVSSGELVAVIGSLGTVEIAVRDGSAAQEIGAARGDGVVARRSR